MMDKDARIVELEQEVADLKARECCVCGRWHGESPKTEEVYFSFDLVDPDPDLSEKLRHSTCPISIEVCNIRRVDDNAN